MPLLLQPLSRLLIIERKVKQFSLKGEKGEGSEGSGKKEGNRSERDEYGDVVGMRRRLQGEERGEIRN